MKNCAVDDRKRILVVDDHPIVREGIALLVNREPDLTVCGGAAEAGEAMTAVHDAHPDLVLMDISIEGTNGLELTKRIRKQYPELPILMLSMHDETLYAERALKAGAQGYVMKHEAPKVVIKAIRQVLRGEVYLSDALSSRLIASLARGKSPRDNRDDGHRLSDRELEVFELIGRGTSTADIAEKMGISPKTVGAHRSHMKEKLGIAKHSEFTLRAIQWVDSKRGL